MIPRVDGVTDEDMVLGHPPDICVDELDPHDVVGGVTGGTRSSANAEK
jgi:hypothetical protein